MLRGYTEAAVGFTTALVKFISRFAVQARSTLSVTRRTGQDVDMLCTDIFVLPLHSQFYCVTPSNFRSASCAANCKEEEGRNQVLVQEGRLT